MKGDREKCLAAGMDGNTYQTDPACGTRRRIRHYVARQKGAAEESERILSKG